MSVYLFIESKELLRAQKSDVLATNLDALSRFVAKMSFFWGRREYGVATVKPVLVMSVIFVVSLLVASCELSSWLRKV